MFYTAAVLGFLLIITEIVMALSLGRVIMSLPYNSWIRINAELMGLLTMLVVMTTVALWFALLTWIDTK